MYGDAEYRSRFGSRPGAPECASMGGAILQQSEATRYELLFQLVHQIAFCPKYEGFVNDVKKPALGHLRCQSGDMTW